MHMPYGTDLQSSASYRKIFRSVEKMIRAATDNTISIGHVGGTSLAIPVGKGDIDVYVSYGNKKEMNELQKILTQLFGKPAKITPDRVRFNVFLNGVEVELQLTDKKKMATAIALRDYLNANPDEAKRYAKSIATLRKGFLVNMSKIKEDFAKKAIKNNV